MEGEPAEGGADIIAGQARASTRSSGGNGLGQVPRTGAGMIPALLFFGREQRVARTIQRNLLQNRPFSYNEELLPAGRTSPASGSQDMIRPSY